MFKKFLSLFALLFAGYAFADAVMDREEFEALLAKQTQRYGTMEEFYENLPACTLVRVEQGTARRLKGATVEFEWKRDSGAFVPTSASCPYGTMKVVQLVRSTIDSMFVPIGTDITVDGKHVMAIIGEQGVSKKHFLGRFRGEDSIRLDGRFYTTDGNPGLPAGLRTARGLFPTFTQFSASATKSSCQSSPVYDTAHVNDHLGYISCW